MSTTASEATAPAARRAARRAVARSTGGDRAVTILLGLLALTAGVAALLVGLGVLGGNRARRPVLDPLAVEAMRSHLPLARSVAIVAGLVLLVLGLVWALRSLRPERRPDVVLDDSADEGLTVSSTALSDALRADAETVDGVSRARVRMVGTRTAPAIRMTLWLLEETDVREVWNELDHRVLARARDALGLSSLPTAVRLELEAATTPRVR